MKKAPCVTQGARLGFYDKIADCDPRRDAARSVEVGQGTPARRRSEPADACVMQDGSVVGANSAERRAVL
jgi:hypothetical protein